MARLKHVALVCEGDAEIPGAAFSGSAHSLLVHLRALGIQVSTVDARLPKFQRGLAAARSFSPDRSHWRARFRYGEFSARAKSRIVEAAVAALPKPVDAVLQIGASFYPPTAGGIPYALWCDWNFALSMKHSANAYSAIHRMPKTEAEIINRREVEIYRGASMIFTFSERLRRSFIEDYGTADTKVMNVRAGPNVDLTKLVEIERMRRIGVPPTVLFIGKEFARKGGDTLLAAFAMVRRQIPDARLIIVGPASLDPVPEGVEFLGLLRMNEPQEYARLIDAYRRADVFCMPSRYEPLGVVVLEAMFAGLPCVTSDVWAIPEMVTDGKTGYVVPPDAPEMLAERLVKVLRDPAMALAMGAAGRVRAQADFTWDAVARNMRAGFEKMVRPLAA